MKTYLSLLALLIFLQILHRHIPLLPPTKPIPSCFDDMGQLLVRSSDQVVKTISSHRIPLIYRQNSNQTFKSILKIEGNPSKVEFSATTANNGVQYNDLGVNGDEKASDGFYTAVLQPLYNPLSLFLGYTDVYEGNIRSERINQVLQVLTSSEQLINPTKVNENIQYSNYVINIKFNQSTGGIPFISNQAGLDQQNASKTMYKYYKDHFDFINLVYTRGFIQNRHHIPVQVVETGTGQNLSNNTANYGSGGQLMGVNVFPNISLYDPANKAQSHEMAHQWIQHFDHPLFKESRAHWPLSNLGMNIMGVSIPGSLGAGGDIPFTISKSGSLYTVSSNPAGNKIFNQWELYLMGLIPSAEVSQVGYIFKDQSTVITNGMTFTSSQIDEIPLSTIISTYGIRTPSSNLARKEFRQATIVFSDNLLTNEEMTYFDMITRRHELQVSIPTIADGLVTGQSGFPFYVATGGKGTTPSNMSGALVSTPVNDQYTAGLIKIYPNPASHMVIIQNINKLFIKEVLIYNQWGQLLSLNKTDTGSDIKIPIYTLPVGVYSIKIRTANNQSIYRFVKSAD